MAGIAARARRLVVLALFSLLVASGTMALTGVPFVGARARFKRLVICPIPPSVRNIQVDRCQIAPLLRRLHGGQEYAFVFRFEISGEDLSRIVAAHAMMPWESPKYAYGRLGYMEGNEATPPSISLYRPRVREPPKWFDLENWTDAETYFAGELAHFPDWGQMSYLLYNEALGIAYWITCQWK
jgi:hypothetical protein